MTEHEYTYDIKMAALIRVRASSKKTACRLVSKAADGANIHFDHLGDAIMQLIVEASVFVDDVQGPCLIAVDGKDIDPFSNG